MIQIQIQIFYKQTMIRLEITFFIILILNCTVHGAKYKNSMFFCGFSGSFCGQSLIDDVNPNINTVILAFVNVVPNGTIVFDQDGYAPQLTDKWHKNGKDVVISVGGQNGHWQSIFASSSSTNNFIQSLVACVKLYKFDGVDLDIEMYVATPRTVANMIINLKKKLNSLGKKLLIVSPEDVTIYQGTQVPGPDSPGQPFNYFVPIVQLADQYIDFYQPQAYNNWYDGLPGGSLKYFQDVYLNWRNLKGYCPWADPIPNFDGVKGSKLRIGLLASSQAGVPNYYGQPEVIAEFKDFLKSNSYQLNGFMIWDSHWDNKNSYAISNACYS